MPHVEPVMAGQDEIRIDRIRTAIRDHGFDGVICALPSNVLLLSGYWPVTGTSIVLATPRRTVLLVPEDEEDLAKLGWADEVRTFEAASLEKLQSIPQAAGPPLREAVAAVELERGRIAYEAAGWGQPASYAAMHVYGGEMEDLLWQAAPQARLEVAKPMIERLRLTKTPREISCIRDACTIAGRAFAEGVGRVRPGETETRVAAAFRTRLMDSTDTQRADGFTYCMSGPNASEAYKAFQRSRQRELRAGDLVLVHCNSYAGGYWTDVTRTYCPGTPDDRQRRMYEAVFAARQAALDAVRPGARAADVDLAARQVLDRHGFGRQFVHPTGHGVGFAAVDHNAMPRLHPKSPDVLEVGMVFNIEPGIYFKGECGMRHCEMVVVGEGGADVLTPFQDRADLLLLS